MTCKDGRFNTGNDVCSNDLRDLNDDVIIVDGYVNSQELYVEDRLGVERLTLAGIQNKSDKQYDDIQERSDNQNTAITDRADSTISKFEGEIDAIIKDAGGVEVVGEFGSSVEDVINQKKISEHLGQDADGNTVIKRKAETFSFPEFGGELSLNKLSGSTVNIKNGDSIMLKILEIVARGVNASEVVTLKLADDYILTEQLIFKNFDCSNIVLSADKTIRIDSTKWDIKDGEARYPIVYAEHGKAPLIDVLFDAQGATKNIAAFHANTAGLIFIEPEKGCLNAERGICAIYGGHVGCTIKGLSLGGGGSTIDTEGVNLRGTKNRAVMVYHGSTVNLPRTQSPHAGGSGDYSAYVIWNSYANLYQSDFSHSGGTAIYVRDASEACARECNVSDSKDRGIHALHGGRIDFRYYANKWSGDGAARCKNYGIMATYASSIDATNAPAFGCITGVMADQVSSICADLVNADNCSYGVRSEGGSKISVTNATAKSCTNSGFRAVRGDITGSDTDYSYCNFGISALQGSNIRVTASKGVECTARAVNVESGSDVIINGSDVSGSTGFGVTVRDGGRCIANSVKATTNNVNTFAFDVRGGANWVSAVGSEGNVSQAINTITKNGIVFK